MSTPIVVADTFATQILTVAAVLAAFPETPLSGGRFKTALAVLQATPANAHIKDDSGDVLCVSFLTPTPSQFVFTQKGKQRLETETSVGY